MQTTKPVTATRVEATAQDLVIVIGDRRVRIPWQKCSPKLAGATGVERSTLELSPGGYDIHWPLIDEDLSIKGLVRENP